MHDHANSASILTKESETARLGAQIRQRRKKLALTQQELAEIAGVSTRSVHALENGKSTLQVGKLADVADALGLKLMLAPREASADDRARRA